METQNNDPLAALESQTTTENKYSFDHLKYPRDIENVLSQGHYINFYIYMHTTSDYLSGASIPKYYNTSNLQFEDSGGKFSVEAQDPGEAIFKTHFKKIKSAISLYTPDDSISFSSKHSWSNESFTKMLGGIGGAAQSSVDVVAAAGGGDLPTLGVLLGLGTATAVTAGASAYIGNVLRTIRKEDRITGRNRVAEPAFYQQLQKDLAGFSQEKLAGMVGIAVNPQYLMMYKETGFRTFAFRFVFTPNNQQEAEDVRNIIKMFRFHASPEVFGTTGRFHLSPSSFEIEFKYKTGTNDNMPKIASCVLSTVSVDYAPRGWATHTDGMPIQTMLELHFIEAEVITKEKITQGY